jgi:hypothetical protein
MSCVAVQHVSAGVCDQRRRGGVCVCAAVLDSVHGAACVGRVVNAAQAAGAAAAVTCRCMWPLLGVRCTTWGQARKAGWHWCRQLFGLSPVSSSLGCHQAGAWSWAQLVGSSTWRCAVAACMDILAMQHQYVQPVAAFGCTQPQAWCRMRPFSLYLCVLLACVSSWMHAWPR